MLFVCRTSRVLFHGCGWVVIDECDKRHIRALLPDLLESKCADGYGYAHGPCGACIRVGTENSRREPWIRGPCTSWLRSRSVCVKVGGCVSLKQ